MDSPGIDTKQLSVTLFRDSNPNAKTIEGDLFKAMVSAGAVSKDNSDDIKKAGTLTILLRNFCPERVPGHCSNTCPMVVPLDPFFLYRSA